MRVRTVCTVCGKPLNSRSDTERCRACYIDLRQFHASQNADVQLEKKRAGRRNWYYKNKEYAQQKHREWLQANKDKVKQYEEEHKQQRIGYVESRRARKANVKSDLTGMQWETLIEVYEHKCAYCLQQFDSFEQDHVVPLAKGGEHTMFNVVPACRTCNRQKSINVIIPKHPAYFNMLVCSAYLNTPATIS